MYYKDNYIEVRLGLGVNEFKAVTNNVASFVLIQLLPDEAEKPIAVFNTNIGLADYPPDGDYKLQVIVSGVTAYYVFISVNDTFIKEFVRQVQDVICNCECSSPTSNCNENKMSLYALKRQRLFNITSLVAYTSKPFSYGQSSLLNPYLFTFFQLYFTHNLTSKKTELGKEYFDYYTTGTNKINNKLFNDVIAVNYYGLYYYSKKLLLTDSGILTRKITTAIDSFFNFEEIKNCLGCGSVKSNVNTLMNTVFMNVDQDNFSRVINVTCDDLSGIGTIEEQIAEYVNSLNYNKEQTDSDIWIEYDDCTDTVPKEPIAFIESYSRIDGLDYTLGSIFTARPDKQIFVHIKALGAADFTVLPVTHPNLNLWVLTLGTQVFFSDPFSELLDSNIFIVTSFSDFRVDIVFNNNSLFYRNPVTNVYGRRNGEAVAQTNGTPTFFYARLNDILSFYINDSIERGGVESEVTVRREGILVYFQPYTLSVTDYESEDYIIDADYQIEISTKLPPPAPINCVVGEWSAWSTCSIEGQQTRTRNIVTEPNETGTPCPPVTETRTCTYVPNVDCVMSNWSDWSTCSAGTQSRTRSIITPASGTGAACGLTVETRACTLPVDCVMSEWGAWSNCISGQRTRTRTVITPASGRGLPCGVLSETEACEDPVTPGDCYSLTIPIVDYDVLPRAVTVSYNSPTLGHVETAFTNIPVFLDNDNYVLLVCSTTVPGISFYIGQIWTYGFILSGGTCTTDGQCIFNPNSPAGRYSIGNAPYGGCEVTYMTPLNVQATETIPEQDAGLSFSIEVGDGGIISDSCGFTKD